MAYENATRILQPEEARVWKNADGIHDDNQVVLFWNGIEAPYVDECIEYLNEDAQAALSAPSFYDISFDDVLYHLHAYYDEETQRIYRIMMRNAVSYAASNFATANDTLWKLQSGTTFTHGPNSTIDLTGAYQILSKTTKTQLQELLKDLLTAPGAVYRNPLISKIHELPAAAPINARIAQLNVEINLLQEEREADITKLRAKRDAVYDQAVFADSPEEVLKTIEAFMAS